MNQYADFVSRITMWDVVDILIVSILIYEALKLVRGTRAMQMFLGSLLVLLLFYISRNLPLPTVRWMVSALLAYIVFAAIVLFQSDIRRALSNLGQAPFFRYLSRQKRAAEQRNNKSHGIAPVCEGRRAGLGCKSTSSKVSASAPVIVWMMVAIAVRSV